MQHKLGMINKGYGVSSFKALSEVKKSLSTKKVGHMGTLDPLATGCLPFASNGLTPLIEFIPKLPKVYEVEIYFGESSPSLDAEFVDLKSLTFQKLDIDVKKIENYLDSIMPNYKQIPPDFSAKKINGKRAYDLARKGIETNLKPKLVDFYEYKILSFKNPVLKLNISCGEGFYVRSLVRDISKLLDVQAFMYSLDRISVGSFNILDSKRGDIVYYDLRKVFPNADYKDISLDEFENLQYGIAPKLDSDNDFIFAYFNDNLVYYSVNLLEVKKQKFLIK